AGCAVGIDVEVLVRLAGAAAGANVDVEGDWRFEEARIADAELPLATAREVPNQTEPWLHVVPELVQLDVRFAVGVVAGLEIPAQAKVELKVLEDLPVVLDIAGIYLRVRVRVKLEIADARAGAYKERIAERFLLGDRAGRHSRDAGRQLVRRQRGKQSG